MATKKNDTTIDVRDKIIQALSEKERSLAWLSRKTEIAYGTLYSCFTHRLFQLSEDNLKKINAVLGTSFE